MPLKKFILGVTQEQKSLNKLFLQRIFIQKTCFHPVTKEEKAGHNYVYKALSF